MFYKRSDTEVLCTTLLKVIDRHDRAVNKFGVIAAIPHRKAIDMIIRKIEIGLTPPIIGIKANVTNSAKKFLDAGKKEITHFSGIPVKQKPKITVVHGASDDQKPAEPITPKETKNGDINPQSSQVEVKEEKSPITIKSMAEGMKKIADTGISLGQTQSTPTPKPTVPEGTVTPENIDTMADQLAA